MDGRSRLAGFVMLTSSLDEREIQLLITALRYWRTHRQGGGSRRTDPPLAPDAVDVLLAKLGSSATDSDRSPTSDSPEHDSAADSALKPR